jgi:PAS domain S-box-containing protein
MKEEIKRVYQIEMFKGISFDEMITNKSEVKKAKKAIDETLKKGSYVTVENYGGTTYETKWHVLEGEYLAGKRLISSYSINVTERETAKKESNIQKAKCNAILKSSVNSIIMIDKNGMMLEVNDSVTRMFGYVKDELINKNVSILLPEPHRSNHNEYIQHYLVSRCPVVIGKGREVIALAKNGEEILCWLSVSEIKCHENIYFIGMISDLRDLKRAHEKQIEMEKQNAFLEVSNRLKTNYIAMINHEIRNPMHGILSYVQLLELTAASHLTEKEREYIQTIKDIGNQVVNIADGVLNFTMLENKEKTLSYFEWLDLSEIIKASILSQINCANKFGVDIMYENNHPVFRVYGNATKLKQIVTNLISNGIKYNKDFAGKIFINVIHDSESEMLCIQIKDTGIGISKSNLKKLFIPFSVVEENKQQAKRKQMNSTGVGLSTVKVLCDEMGFNVSVDSQVGTGSKFMIAVPQSKFLVATPNIQLEGKVL